MLQLWLKIVWNIDFYDAKTNKGETGLYSENKKKL